MELSEEFDCNSSGIVRKIIKRFSNVSKSFYSSIDLK